MSSEYAVFETEVYAKSLKKLKISNLSGKLLRTVYPSLKRSPHAGPNIKKLKGEFPFAYRYRIGRYRITYVIDDDARAVYLTNIQHRKDAFR
ncbi:MAG: type II toxin-antitoxin system RelE/ParE family toxin [Leptospirales bacterium]|nr:type II toxin-antitoxin system RelE/ParE family toxin [Leptospirales bacterium]